MSDTFDDEFARRLSQIADSVAGLSEEDAVQVLELRLARAQRTGAAGHRLSLAQARGTLANALAEDAEADVLASLEEMVASIESSTPTDLTALGTAARLLDANATDFDPELATAVAHLLQRHRDNAVTILGHIAKASVAGDTALVARLEALLAHDLDGLSELENR